jgi:hypothetical protein
MWIKLQRAAHFHEGERSVSRVGKNPEVRFSELLLPGRFTCLEISLKASHRVDKNRAHQAFNSLDCSRTSPGVVKLNGQHSLRLKWKLNV